MEKRIKAEGTDFYISNTERSGNAAEEHLDVIRFDVATPTLRVFEDGQLVKTFVMETLTANPDLTGQFFHISVRLLGNGGVMIDGVISRQHDRHPHWEEESYEGIRLQPFFLSTVDPRLAQQLTGKGLFERGLHYSGLVTPATVRVICLCDTCNKSFTIQHFHGGFSESQYFYSDDSKQTLIVQYSEIKNAPTHLQREISQTLIEQMEAELPKPTKGTGSYRYYNSFRCPHCVSPYIDFQTNKEIRPGEYYGNKFINDKFYTIADHL